MVTFVGQEVYKCLVRTVDATRKDRRCAVKGSMDNVVDDQFLTICEQKILFSFYN